MKRKTLSIIALVLVCMFVFSACGTGTNNNGTTTATTTATTKSTTATTAATTATTAPASSEPTKITAFMQEAGQNFPDGFDHNNNWMMDVIKSIANIEFSELIVPAYMDTETKFNLMMASGSIPDYVHRAHRVDMRRYGEEGAFADLSGIFAGSATLSEKYNQVMIEAMKASDGKIYVLDTLPINDDYSALFLRMDLLDKAGYDKTPSTLDEFVDAMRAVKAWDPSSVVYTCRALAYQEWFMTQPFNTQAAGWKWYEERNAYCNSWEGDNIVRATEFAKMLYDEGLLDKEFVTNNGDAVNQKRLKNNCLIWAQNRGGIVARLEMLAKDGQADARIIPVEMPIADGVGITKYETSPNVYGSHCVAINAKSKPEAFDACVRLIEALLSDEVYELCCYGREGTDYQKTANGNVPILPSAVENAWRSVYGYVFTYNTSELMNYSTTVAIYSATGMTDADKADYTNKFMTSMNAIQANDLCKLPYSPTVFLESAPNEINNLVTEAAELQRSLMAKAIMGEISIDDFKVQKEDLVKKYQSVTDYYTEKIAPVLASQDRSYSK